MKIFISYCDEDGLEYAKQTALILENCGHIAWYFDRNKTPGVPRIYDITKHIRSWCDIIFYLCTHGSLRSRGQWEEIGHWDRTNKQLIPIVCISAAGDLTPIRSDRYSPAARSQRSTSIPRQ